MVGRGKPIDSGENVPLSEARHRDWGGGDAQVMRKNFLLEYQKTIKTWMKSAFCLFPSPLPPQPPSSISSVLRQRQILESSICLHLSGLLSRQTELNEKTPPRELSRRTTEAVNQIIILILPWCSVCVQLFFLFSSLIIQRAPQRTNKNNQRSSPHACQVGLALHTRNEDSHKKGLPDQWNWWWWKQISLRGWRK